MGYMRRDLGQVGVGLRPRDCHEVLESLTGRREELDELVGLVLGKYLELFRGDVDVRTVRVAFPHVMRVALEMEKLAAAERARDAGLDGMAVLELLKRVGAFRGEVGEEELRRLGREGCLEELASEAPSDG